MAVTILNAGSVVSKANQNQSILNIRCLIQADVIAGKTATFLTTPIIAVDGPLYGIGVGPQSDFNLYSVAYAEEIDSSLQLTTGTLPAFVNVGVGLVAAPPATTGAHGTSAETQGFGPQSPWLYSVNPDYSTPSNPQFNTGKYVIGISNLYRDSYAVQVKPVLDLFLLVRPGTLLPHSRTDRSVRANGGIGNGVEVQVAQCFCYGRKRKTIAIKNNDVANGLSYRVEACTFNPSTTPGAFEDNTGDISVGTLAAGKSAYYTNYDLFDCISVFATGLAGNVRVSVEISVSDT